MLGHIIQYWLRGKGLVLSESLPPPPEVLRISLEISPKLPDEMTKCSENSKQWLQVCYHCRYLCKLWYTKHGKSSLAGCGEEGNSSVESGNPDDLLLWDSNNVVKAGVGSFDALPKRWKSSQKKDPLFWSTKDYSKNCPETTALVQHHWESSSFKQALNLSCLLPPTICFHFSLEWELAEAWVFFC